jgi:hypothetical protein
LASLGSVVGDQLARVALASLVFDQTRSAAWTAVSWALTFLPAMGGGIWLGHLADRYPRRRVLVATDLVRAGLIGAMAWPGLPLWAMCLLVATAVTLGPVFTAAQGALLPDILRGGLYDRGVAALQITGQAGQLAGFATAGAVVAALGARAALLVDAATFLCSAGLLLAGLQARAAPRPATGSTDADVRAPSGLRGLAMVLRDPRRRPLVLLAWLVGCYVVPDGLAVPYTAELGVGPIATGALLASLPAGSIVGAWLLTHVVPDERRPRLVGWLAAAAGLPLLIAGWVPHLVVIGALWAMSGACTMAYLVQTQISFVQKTPREVRGQGLGAVGAGVIASQGIVLVIAGGMAEQTGTATTIAAAGAAGLVLAAVISVLHSNRAVREQGP